MQPETLVALLQRVARDPVYRCALTARARKRSADFSWRKTAQLTAEVYRECR
jgi:glycosyltransferase involved in cell wall biosynthesis